MAQQRLAMHKIKDILRLHLLGGVTSCRRIGRAVGCGKTAVSQCLQRAAAAGKHRLSPRELQIVELGARGLVNKEIAYELSLSDRTIQSHWRNIFTKLGVGSRMEAVMQCLKNEWIRLGGD